MSDGTKVKPDFNNIVTGTDTSDNITSGHSNDEITLSTGNDVLTDLGGNDTYIFNVGDGIDTINDLSGTDTIAFANISKEDLFFTQKNDNFSFRNMMVERKERYLAAGMSVESLDKSR